MNAAERHWSEHLFDKPILRTVPGWEDPHASYSFDIRDLVQTADGWYLVGTSGCSCPSYEEQAGIEAGPMSLSDLEAWFRAEYDNEHVGNYYRECVPDVLRAFEEARS